MFRLGRPGSAVQEGLRFHPRLMWFDNIPSRAFYEQRGNYRVIYDKLTTLGLIFFLHLSSFSGIFGIPVLFPATLTSLRYPDYQNMSRVFRCKRIIDFLYFR